MEDRDLIDFEARTKPPPEIVVIPDSPAGLWGDPEPVPAPVHVAAPATAAPDKSVALPSSAPAPAPERFARKRVSTRATASWVAVFAGVGVFAGGLYLALSWASEAFAAVGRWFTGPGPWLVLGALLVAGTVVSRVAPVRARRSSAGGYRAPGGFAVSAGGYPRGRGSLGVVGGAAVAGVRRVLHGNRGAAAQDASAGVWSDASSPAGYGGYGPAVAGSGVRQFGADGVELTYPTAAYGAAGQYGSTYPDGSMPGHVDPATGLYVVHGPGLSQTDPAGQPQWMSGIAAGYSAGAYAGYPDAQSWSSDQAKPAREMTRPAALATWLFGPAEGPAAYGSYTPGVLSQNRWATQTPGTRASALDPSIDRTFSAWLFDASAPWMQGSGAPVRGERMSIKDMTLTHRWCERMRNAAASEIVHGQWSAGQRAILSGGAPCKFCAVGFLFDESDPNGWSHDGSVFAHTDAAKLFARYGREFLMGVSNIFEEGMPLPQVADYVEEHCI